MDINSWETCWHVMPICRWDVQRAIQVAPSQKAYRLLCWHSCLGGQEVVRFLVHPKAPVQRLLVDHPTGSGKTREMISILDNFFYDPRPKVVIFPKAAICH